MKDIVEHVARAVRDVGSMSMYPRLEDLIEAQNRAAIRATLQYARDNVSEETAGAFRNAAFAYREAREMTPAEAAASILSALLSQIEGGGK